MHLLKYTCATLFSLLILAIPASAQLDAVDKIADGASRLIYLAKSIKELIVEPVEQTEPGNKATADSFEIVARDADGKVIDISGDEARKLYKWTAKDSSGKIVSRKGTIERLKAADDKLSRARNILKLVKEGGSKAVKLEMRLADQYTTYSAASGTAAIAKPVAVATKAGGMGKFITSHPYWSAAGGVAVAGGAAAAAGGGGGGSSDTSSTTSTGADSSATGTGGDSSAASTDGGSSSASTDVTGVWSGHAGSDSITFNLVQSGNSISGTHTTVPEPGNGPTNAGSLSGTINGNSISLTVVFSDGSPSAALNGTVSGNTMSGSWSDGPDSGPWSVTKN
jgi:hypothetical protein